MAILVALASPELEVLGITCVAGNVELALTSTNARKICELAGMPKTQIFLGADRPLSRPLVTATHVHGRTGLDGTDLASPVMPISQTHAVDFIIETFLSAKSKEIVMCALGPLTNIAMAITKEPRIVPKIKKIVLMGGGFFEGGNITPAAEFNIYVDPEAASTLLNSGIEVVMIPLDVTHKVLATSKFIDSVSLLGSKTGTSVAGLLSFFGRYDSSKYGSDGAPLHDPNVIVYLLKPEYYFGKKINVQIEMKSELTLGMTVADWWKVTQNKENVTFIREVKTEAVLNLILSRLGSLP